MTESLRTAAVKYARDGFRIFPVQPAVTGDPKSGKRPLVSKADGGNGCLDATSDTATVDAWWEVSPNANIGMHCGPGSRVFVVDLDTGIPPARPGKDEERISGLEALERLEAEHGAIPPTKRAETGSGGVHLFFRCPKDREIRNRSGLTIAPGVRAKIDIRAEGGYVVLPPSVHHSGRAYRWASQAPIADAPEWLLDIVAPIEAPKPVVEWNRPAPVADGSPKAKYAAKVLESKCADIATAREGRHDVLNVNAFVIGGYVANGYISRDTAERELYAAAVASMGEGRDREIRRTIADALDKGGEKPLDIPDRPMPERTLPEPPAWLDEAPPIDDDFIPSSRVVPLHPPKPSAPVRVSGGGGGFRAAGAALNLDEEEEADPDRLPKIQTKHRQQVAILRDAWRALLRANAKGQPQLYTTAGKLTRIERSEQGAMIRPYNENNVRHGLIHAATWMTKRKATPHDGDTVDGWIEVNAETVPREIPGLVLSNPVESLPIVEQVVYGPTFDKHGALLEAPGYHPSAFRWYEAEAPLELVPMTVDESVALLYDWLADFPFDDGGDNVTEGRASRANAIALFLLPFVRDMVGDITPLHVFEAGSPGTGKTLLTECLLLGSMGRTPSMQALPEKEDEIHKVLSAMLFAGRQAIVFDNIKSAIRSASLESAITAKHYEARVLGLSQTVQVPVRSVWALVANNPQMGEDIIRRSVRVRLVRLKPFRREDARHADIAQWTAENRARLVSAAITLVQHWIDSGQPAGSETLAGFERWARVIGGILSAAGIEGFMENAAALRRMADPMSEEWAVFADKWFDHNGGEMMTASDLLDLADRHGLLAEVTEGKSDRVIAFGRRLRAKVDNVLGKYRLRFRRSTRAGYQLVAVGGKA